MSTFAPRQHHLPGCATSQGAPGPWRAVRPRRSAVGALCGGEEARDVPVSHTCEWPRPPHRSAPSSCWSLACQSGLRRCRHASTTSAASAMLSCVSSQPPAQSRSMSVVLYEWQASARDNFRLIHGRCSTHSSCGSCTSAPSTTPTVAHAPLVGALWDTPTSVPKQAGVSQASTGA